MTTERKHREFVGVMELLCVLMVVEVVAQMYACVNIRRDAHESCLYSVIIEK